MTKLLFALLLTIASIPSQASILIEPYLGYTLADLDDGNQKYDANGMVYGARIGYEVPLLWFALDFQRTAQDIDYTSGSRDGEANRIGVVVGATVPLGLRAWAGYYIQDKIKIKTSSGGENEYSGTGLKIGAGLRLIPLLHLNAEYIMSKYDEINGSSLASDDEINGLYLTLSVPLSI